VVDTCGISKSQLYHYFPDKDALVADVIAMRAHRLVSQQKPLLDRVCSMRDLERWRDLLMRHREGGKPYRCSIGALANELACSRDDARRSLAAVFETWQGMLADGLARMRDSGELDRGADPEALAVAVIAALEGGYLLAGTMQDERPLMIALDMALDLVRAQVRDSAAALTESDN